ncbi:MAG: Fe2+-dependent dioxygenase [Oceanobacter sp.]
MLLPIEGFLTPEETAQCRELLYASEWQDGKKSAGGIAREVKNNLQLDDKTPTAQKIRGLIQNRLSRHPMVMSAVLIHKIFPPKFNCYQNGGHYGPHIDGSIMTRPDGQQLRTDVSATLFFTEPDSYDGGELMIETQYGAQSVKLNAGDLILYPSTSLHQVLPVTRGQRICSFMWFQSLVADSQKREMLFELDQSIQALTMDRGAGDEEVVRLSGIYHNLLRQWAEV